MDDNTCSGNSSIPGCYEDSSDPLVLLFIPSLLALSTVLGMALIFHRAYKNRRRAQQSASQNTAGSGAEMLQTALDSWELPEDCALEGLEVCQSGRYGPISTALLTKRDGASLSVVVKSLRDEASQTETEEFVEWLHFHSSVCRHENVVRLLHIQTSHSPMCLVMEACSPGNLLHFLWTLRNTSSPPLQNFSENSVFVVAKQVALGLDYLLSEHRLVHGYVAARSISLGPGHSARVSGLDVAFAERRADPAIRVKTEEEEEVENEEEGQEGEKVPLKWQAPERMMFQLSIDRSDVWSFGILLYELITLGSCPYPELEPQDVLLKLQADYRMSRPKHCGEALYNLMKCCWTWSYKERPPFSTLIKHLDSSLHLAGNTHICIPELINISEYNSAAGL